VLQDPDIMEHVMQYHATASGGWCQELWRAGRVCHAWRDAVNAARMDLEAWTSFRWDIKYMSKILPGCRMESPIFTCGSGAYSWKMMLCTHHDITDDDEMTHIALFLCLAEEGDGEPHLELCSRTTQFELQVLDPRSSTSKHSQRELNVDVGVLRTWAVKEVTFKPDLRSWGHPRFHPLATLQEDGWVGADDIMRLTVHLRVRNGRCRCPQALTHRLAPADPRRTYARYGGAWHCDSCGKSGKVDDPMFHCTAGCEYDLCSTCQTSKERTTSLRSRNRKGKQPAGSPDAPPSYNAFWVH